jgi:WXG100 family type VII secretion target
MAGQIKVNTEQVEQIAGNIERLNNQLNDSLKNSQQTITNLKNSWEGQASDATISSFNEFAQKYFQNYYDVIDQYVKFLRQNVATGYFQTETANSNLADAFK